MSEKHQPVHTLKNSKWNTTPLRIDPDQTLLSGFANNTLKSSKQNYMPGAAWTINIKGLQGSCKKIWHMQQLKLLMEGSLCKFYILYIVTFLKALVAVEIHKMIGQYKHFLNDLHCWFFNVNSNSFVKCISQHTMFKNSFTEHYGVVVYNVGHTSILYVCG